MATLFFVFKTQVEPVIMLWKKKKEEVVLENRDYVLLLPSYKIIKPIYTSYLSAYSFRPGVLMLRRSAMLPTEFLNVMVKMMEYAKSDKKDRIFYYAEIDVNASASLLRKRKEYYQKKSGLQTDIPSSLYVYIPNFKVSFLIDDGEISVDVFRIGDTSGDFLAYGYVNRGFFHFVMVGNENHIGRVRSLLASQPSRDVRKKV